MTLSEENYLKAVYHLQKEYQDGVPTNAIAEEMETKASSATDMVKRLSEKGILHYVPYQGVTLTKLGNSRALNIIRKHRLWEVFLVKKLGFNWDEVHDLAEQLEHIKSDQLTDRLDRFLEYPSVDPHGDPIPDKEGKFPMHKKILLVDCNPGDKGVIAGVNDSSKAFLQYLDRYKISLNDTIEIVMKEEYDNSVLVVLNGSEKILSEKTAQNLFLRLDNLED